MHSYLSQVTMVVLHNKHCSVIAREVSRRIEHTPLNANNATAPILESLARSGESNVRLTIRIVSPRCRKVRGVLSRL
jgi:hypothetical protein